MGRKWTNISFKLENHNKPISEASSNPKTQEEALYDYIIERWGTDNANPHENIDLSFGSPSENKLENWLESIFEQFEFVKKAGVIFLTDSAYVGHGTVYKRAENGCIEKIDTYDGAEGARGNDVADYIYDKYYIKVSPEWVW